MTNINRRRFLAATPLVPAVLAAATTLRPLPGYAAGSPAEPLTRDGLPLFHRTRVGKIEVIALLDGYATLPTSLITGLSEAEAAKAAKAAYKPHDPQMMSIAVNGYIIKTGKRVIAIDTGAPSAMAPTVGRWNAARQAAGIPAEEIDTVFLTHLHGDHVGGLSDALSGGSSRLLPNAEFVCTQAEWDFTHDAAVYNALPEAFRGNFDAARALVAPYTSDRKTIPMAETEIAPGVTAVPLPGHTPGHAGILVESDGEQLLIWGDIVHAPGYQFAHPEWSIVFDADPTLAQETRRAMLDRASADRLMVAGMHLDFPALGYVERQAGAYRYIPAPMRYDL